MTVERAISMLKEAKDVENWNNIREYIKTQLSTEEWFQRYQYLVDASGLIVKVLGPDVVKN